LRRNNFFINYVFFGSIFFILFLVHLFHLNLIEGESVFLRLYFVLNILLQCFLEISLLCLIASLICRFLPRFVLNIFTVLTFFLFLFHIVDFPLVRFMDMSIWFTLDFVKDESYQNFIEMLYASNISLTSWILGGVAGICLIGLGILFFLFSEKISQKWPFRSSFKMWSTTFVACFGFLFISDFSLSKNLSHHAYDRFVVALPWKTTFNPPESPSLEIALPPHTITEEEIQMRLGSVKNLAHKPDIFLFVIESLREDFLDDRTAPYLHRFSRENISFPQGVSNANATQISWFSLFYSQQPFYWANYQPSKWKSGSIPLQALKKLGYTIHVLSSARLEYYQMDQMIFGKDRYLADVFLEFPHRGNIQACESDEQAMRELKRICGESPTQSGRLFIVFLDSTHFDYSWPKQMTRFFPISEINYLTAMWSKDNLETIKNRYRNSIFYIDSLIGEFFSKMSKKSYEDSIVIVTGDHGEEFYEQGHLFHASVLSKAQTHIPLYYKFATNSTYVQKEKKKLTCHLDVFPSIFHFLMQKEEFSDLLGGYSIFSDRSFPFVISARYNAGRCPFEFLIHNGTYKLIAQFENQKDIFKSKKVNILSTRTDCDEIIPMNMDFIEKEFGAAFKEVFSR